jgi:ATP-dependent HslUV protease ATP-binding subunit HslU
VNPAPGGESPPVETRGSVASGDLEGIAPDNPRDGASEADPDHAELKDSNGRAPAAIAAGGPAGDQAGDSPGEPPGDPAEPAAEPAGESAVDSPPSSRPADVDQMRPAEIVHRLDEYIVGQAAAKRAVAVALRNRVRRQKLPDDMRAEVLPKNILMIGPTGVGKTEIARRLARMTHSPFIKVEATKFTEVGYVGRDVESIVRDLLEQTITEVHNDRIAEVEDKAAGVADQRILDALVDTELERAARNAARDQALLAPAQDVAPQAPAAVRDEPVPVPAGSSDAAPTANGAGAEPAPAPAGPEGASDELAPPAPDAELPRPAPEGSAIPSEAAEELQRRRRRLIRRRIARRLEARQLEDREVEIEVEEPWQPAIEGFSGTGFEDFATSLSDFFSQLAPPRKRRKRMTVAEARTVLTQEETDKLIDMDRVYDDAIADVEERGIVFVDEIDKIAGPGSETGPDVSGQGVQRDLLPLLEGSTVHTRYGAVHTDHILFMAAGAFTMSRPSDLIPEMQGRFPIRVELSALTEADLERILVEPSNALTKQYAALLGTENVTLDFTEEGIHELATQAARVNDDDENIGARRLFTILEKVLEEVSFSAEDHAGTTVRVDADFVRARLTDLVRNEDTRRYIL